MQTTIKPVTPTYDEVLSTPALNRRIVQFRARIYESQVPMTAALLTDLDDVNPGGQHHKRNGACHACSDRALA